jgi:hypothetical protein
MLFVPSKFSVIPDAKVRASEKFKVASVMLIVAEEPMLPELMLRVPSVSRLIVEIVLLLPVSVRVFVSFTFTVVKVTVPDKVVAPAPASVNATPLEPVTEPLRAVVIEVSVVMVELADTVTSPELVTLPVT